MFVGPSLLSLSKVWSREVPGSLPCCGGRKKSSKEWQKEVKCKNYGLVLAFIPITSVADAITVLV